MKVAIEILILNYLLLFTWASPTGKVKKFPVSSAEENNGDYNIEEVLHKAKDNQNLEIHLSSVEEHTLKENDRRKDYVRYYFKKPSKASEDNSDSDSSDSNGSSDSSSENLKSFERELNNANTKSEKAKHKESSEESKDQKLKNKKDKKASKDSSDESESSEKSDESKDKSEDSSEQIEVKIDDRDDSDSAEIDSSEASLKISPLAFEQTAKQNFDQKEDSKIKSLIKKLNKSLNNTDLEAKDLQDVDIEKIIKESAIREWKEIEIVVKLLLIDNYKYVKKALVSEIINNTHASQFQVFKLEETLFREYYLSKKNISQTVKQAKKKFKIEFSQTELNKNQIHEVEQLYVTQLRNQIDEKLLIFKQNIKSNIDQFELELKSTLNNSVSQHRDTIAAQNDPNLISPSDTVNKIELTNNYEKNPFSIDIIAAGHIAEGLPQRSGTEVDKNINNHLDGSMVSNAGVIGKLNEVPAYSDTKSSKNSPNLNNPTIVENNVNGITQNKNGLIDTSAGPGPSSLKINDLRDTDSTKQVIGSAVSAGNSPTEVLQQDDLNSLHSGTVTKNEQNRFTQENSADLVASNIVKQNENNNIIGKERNVDIELAHPSLLTTGANEKTKLTDQSPILVDITGIESQSAQGAERQPGNGVIPLNSKAAADANENHNSLISNTLGADSTNSRLENLASQSVDGSATAVESESDVNLPTNLPKSAVNGNELQPSSSLDNLSNPDNTKNEARKITIGSNHVTSNAGNSDNLSEINEVDLTKTLAVNNKSNEPLSITDNTDNSQSNNQLTEVVEGHNTIKDNQINNADQRNVIDATATELVTDTETDGINAAQSPVDINKTDNPEKVKQDSKVISYKNEVLDTTNGNTVSQTAQDPILDITKTNSHTSAQLIDNVEDKNNAQISQKNENTNTDIVNNALIPNDSQAQQKNDVILTDTAVITENNQESIQSSNNDNEMKNSIQNKNGDINLNGIESESTKNEQNPKEVNILESQSNIASVNDITSDTANKNYPTRSEQTNSVTNDKIALHNNLNGQHEVNDPIANPSVDSTNSNNDATKELFQTGNHPNEVPPGNNLNNEITSNNLDRQSQKPTIPVNSAENLKNEQSVEPIDGNAENFPAQTSLDSIPHDVNAETVQDASNAEKISKINITSKKSGINTAADYGSTKLIDDNKNVENSQNIPVVETVSESQNLKDENIVGDFEKQPVINDPTAEVILTPYDELAKLSSGSQQVNAIQYETAPTIEIESTTDNYLHNEHEAENNLKNAISGSSLPGKNSELIFNENKKTDFTDNSVTVNNGNIPDESNNLNENNALHGPSDLPVKSTQIEVNNDVAENNQQLTENQFEKITPSNPSKSDEHHTETNALNNAAATQKQLNEIIQDDSAKIVGNKTSTIDSTNGDTSNLDIIADKDLHTEPKVQEITQHDSKIITPDTPTYSEPSKTTLTPTVITEASTNGIVTEQTIGSTTIMPETNECTDVKGVIVDCESLILSSSGNIENTNTNTENKKPVPVWPGIPNECLPLFLSSDGTVLKEIPSVVNITDAQTRNLCVSIAITIIQLNRSSNPVNNQ